MIAGTTMEERHAVKTARHLVWHRAFRGARRSRDMRWRFRRFPVCHGARSRRRRRLAVRARQRICRSHARWRGAGLRPAPARHIPQELRGIRRDPRHSGSHQTRQTADAAPRGRASPDDRARGRLWPLRQHKENRLMERHEILEAMSELKLYGMRASFDEIAGKGLARRDEIYPLIASLIRAERTHRQARSISYRIGGAKFPGLKDIDKVVFPDTPVDEGLVREIPSGGLLDAHRNAIFIRGTRPAKTHSLDALG